MRKTPLKKIGTVVKANIVARKRIAAICEERNLNYCELGFEDCTRTWPLAPCHKHPRGWYMGSVERLSDFNEFIVGCQNCHAKLDSRSQTSQEESDAIFDKLRP